MTKKHYFGVIVSAGRATVSLPSSYVVSRLVGKANCAVSDCILLIHSSGGCYYCLAKLNCQLCLTVLKQLKMNKDQCSFLK